MTTRPLSACAEGVLAPVPACVPWTDVSSAFASAGSGTGVAVGASRCGARPDRPSPRRRPRSAGVPAVRRAALLMLLALSSGLALAPPAEARFGVHVSFGGVLPVAASPRASPYPSWARPPPISYVVPPPPYAYPSYGYLPPPGPPTAVAQACRAGALSCPAGQQARPGDACNCPTPRGPAWGRVGG